uniref:Glucose-1-phosphate thymidylyltransferase n=1 Tax=candidate division WOR-3 bacterium TaxID=2052148 RepID=A0A7V4E307_UNCW3
MKGLILSGGKGTRLRPITHYLSKQLIPVANKPVLFYSLEAMQEAGIKDVGIVIGDTWREIKEIVQDGKRWNLNVTYIHQEAPLGLAHAVMISEDFIGKEPFVMYLGDNILKEGIKRFVKEFEEKLPDAQIFVSEVSNPQDFGVVIIKEGKIVKLIEKPKKPKSNLALVGVYIFNHHIFKAVKNLKPSWRGEYEITDAINWLLNNKYKVNYLKVKGWWKDTGKPEDLIEANRIILEDLIEDVKGKVKNSKIIGKVNIGENTIVENSHLRGPVIIGKNCIIKDSYIGPFTSISDECEIIKAEIEDSIIMEGSKIIEIEGRIEESIIGKEVLIKKNDLKRKVKKFVIGDHSIINLE